MGVPSSKARTSGGALNHPPGGASLATPAAELGRQMTIDKAVILRAEGMARGACTFRRRDVTAAVKAVKAAGCEVARAEIDCTGKIVVVIGKPQGPDAVDDLDRELTTFEARIGQN
jgi:hypothetical protein